MTAPINAPDQTGPLDLRDDSFKHPELQHRAFEERFGESSISDWDWYAVDDPATRLQTDRCLDRALDRLLQVTKSEPQDWRVLIVCGGVGGEASQLLARGFVDVTNSDFSGSALDVARQREPSVTSLELNAEALDLADDSFDLVIERAGLHHLPRPVLGFNEMLRVARKAVIVVEPNTGLITRLFGQEFEEEHGEINYVFRWSTELIEQSTKSWLLDRPVLVENLRTLHHHRVWLWAQKICRGNTKRMYPLIRGFYWFAGALLDRIGNTFVGLVVLDPDQPHRSSSVDEFQVGRS